MRKSKKIENEKYKNKMIKRKKYLNKVGGNMTGHLNHYQVSFSLSKLV